MKTYLIWKKITGSFRIYDTDDKAAKELLSKEITYRKMKEGFESLHPVTKRYGEISDITFLDIEKIRNCYEFTDSYEFADDYYVTGTYTIRTNKLLSVLDKIAERYNYIKKYGISFSELIYLIKNIIQILETDFKDLERKSLLQIKED